MKLDTMEAWKAYEAYDADLRVAVLQGEQRATISNIVTDMIEEVEVRINATYKTIRNLEHRRKRIKNNNYPKGSSGVHPAYSLSITKS